jgi:thioredoxin-related protein
MAKNWPKYIESIANVALILCCLVVTAFLTRNYISSRNHDPNSNPKPKVGSKPASSLVGTKLTTPAIDWTKNQQTLLFVLKKGCRFCDESAPFYQRLTKEFSTQSKTHFIALLPHSNDESKQYLKDKTVDIPDLRQGSAESIGVPGTPTLLLVDNTGTVIEQWLGKLPAVQEEAVIFRLKR